jgi:hypothetical protein
VYWILTCHDRIQDRRARRSGFGVEGFTSLAAAVADLDRQADDAKDESQHREQGLHCDPPASG